jgi:hypothetical protein
MTLSPSELSERALLLKAQAAMRAGERDAASRALAELARSGTTSGAVARIAHQVLEDLASNDERMALESLATRSIVMFGPGAMDVAGSLGYWVAQDRIWVADPDALLMQGFAYRFGGDSRGRLAEGGGGSEVPGPMAGDLAGSAGNRGIKASI